MDSKEILTISNLKVQKKGKIWKSYWNQGTTVLHLMIEASSQDFPNEMEGKEADTRLMFTTQVFPAVTNDFLFHILFTSAGLKDLRN